MTIKRSQIAVWNKKCGNGFKVNLRQAIWRGQKYLHKYIRLSPEYLLEVSIKWKTEIAFRKWVYPILRFDKWHKKGDLLSSTVGKGYEVRLQEDRKRKNFNDLLEISNADNGLKDEQLIKMFKRLSQEKEEEN